MTERKSDVGRLGGGLIAAAVGLSEHVSPLEAYLRITGEASSEAESEDIDRGVFLEPALRAWAAQKLGAVVAEPGTMTHREVPWATYTPDGVLQSPAFAGPELLEIKSPGLWRERHWGEEGTDEVPRDALLQGAWGLEVTGLTKVRFAALIRGRLRIFVHERDVELSEMLWTKARHFMEKHVATKTPPPPSFSDADTAWVKKRWPRNEKPALEWPTATDGQRLLIRGYVEAYVQSKAAEKTLAELENALKLEIADRAGVLLGALVDTTGYGGGSLLNVAAFDRIDWKQNKPSEKTDWQTVAHALGQMWMQREMDLSASPKTTAAEFPAKFEAVVKEFTKVVQGARPFVPRKRQKE